ncbi:MAG: hypothetical protein IPK07_20710 [Deltaproteobacteria bacterium]|jgi:hypothetical protein|nr:hypothetical protein [Deltaproteobacteria bacterium]
MISRANYEFHDDTIHPSQHFTAGRVALPGDGERRLMGAILEDAVSSFESASNSDTEAAKALVEDLIEWFADEDDTYLFSFPSICDYLQIKTETVRNHIKQVHWAALKEKARKREALAAEAPTELSVDQEPQHLKLAAVAG